MATTTVGTTTALDNWDFQGNYVERLMDNAAFTAAHPQNTLVLAGPPRFPDGANPGDQLLPLGMLQNMSVGQGRPLQPIPTIGTSRTFFTTSKGIVNWSIGRLMVNGRNLYRALYTSAIQSGIDTAAFRESPVRSDRTEQFYVNLDSELAYVPFGLAVLFRSVANDAVGAFYLELCMISNMNMNTGAGQSFIATSITGMADRIRPIYPDTLTGVKGAPTSSTIITNVMKQDANPTPDLASR